MPVFCCLIRGENFPGSIAGTSEPIGFYTTRFVEASSASAAELVALEMLRAEPEFALVRRADRIKDAQVFFEKIEEVPAELDRSSGKGFTFFPMDD